MLEVCSRKSFFARGRERAMLRLDLEQEQLKLKMKPVRRNLSESIVSRNRKFSWIRKIQLEYTFVLSKISMEWSDSGWIKCSGSRVRIYKRVHSLFACHILAIHQIHQKWGYSKNPMDLAQTNSSSDLSADTRVTYSFLRNEPSCAVRIWRTLYTSRGSRHC